MGTKPKVSWRHAWNFFIKADSQPERNINVEKIARFEVSITMAVASIARYSWQGNKSIQ